ncbi:NAD-dependent epimerase/dehydratase family protein [Nakamurella flavida]|uniref:NAD-dependent epimerase/dehydratase family protein n=1 Tax=Nakamurella flavida TaxID=363630 RepID=A0A939C655_9ACTN|nr:NAD-dependent epimerase/dehydratase family protein [Nakamurella flavida]MBM9476867.1 NAD-dependent epimerase/dehydratase family protein [Nakamurella flavida]MDP9779811.1 nucleoside-diphosphate-sugar epimerase [Nakamurella flavida]
MRIAVIGGSGHIGTYLVPRLVRAGHEVLALSRGTSHPYSPDDAWSSVTRVTVDRTAEDAAGTFGARVAALDADVVVDLICFTPESAVALVDALRGHTGHLLHCGSIWRYGVSHKLPMHEDDTSPPFGEYGVQKAAIAELLAAETRGGGLVTTVVQPGHISGPGWMPIGPLGNLDPGVWQALCAGEEIAVPGAGSELLHHVHADDVAQVFALAVEHRDAAAGQAFNAVAPSALTVRGFLEIAAGWFDQPLRTRSVSWDEFRAGTTAEFADASWEHLHRSQFASLDKARTLLGHVPIAEPEEAVREGIAWLIEHGELEVRNPLVGSGRRL